MVSGRPARKGARHGQRQNCCRFRVRGLPAGGFARSGGDCCLLAEICVCRHGSLAFLGGGQLSFGIYFNPGLSGQDFGLGVYSSQGAAVGFNVGAGAYVGALNENSCKLKGNTVDVNATVGYFQASTSFSSDGTESGIVGGAVGIPGGASVSYSHTESFGIEDIVPAIQRFEFNAMNALVSSGRW